MATGTLERPLNNNVEFVNINIGVVSSETMLDKAKRSIAGGYLPKGKAFSGQMLSGSYFYIAGYVYESGSSLYGSYFIGTYNGCEAYAINNGNWSPQISPPYSYQEFADQISTTHTKNAGFNAVKSGNICSTNQAYTLTSAVNAYGVIATLPSVFRPYNQIVGRDIDITASGNVRALRNMTSGTVITEYFTYIAYIT